MSAPFTFGNLGRNTVRQLGMENWDMGLYKSFPIRENRESIQFRAEFFNAFNHPNFANPNASFTLANSGTGGSFGKVSNTLNPILGTGSGGPGDPREIQLALKLYF